MNSLMLAVRQNGLSIARLKDDSIDVGRGHSGLSMVRLRDNFNNASSGM